ncbi:MAG: hypothetical protein ACJZ9B_05800 [Coraliomargaritaceae bacterium]
MESKTKKISPLISLGGVTSVLFLILFGQINQLNNEMEKVREDLKNVTKWVLEKNKKTGFSSSLKTSSGNFEWTGLKVNWKTKIKFIDNHLYYECSFKNTNSESNDVDKIKALTLYFYDKDNLVLDTKTLKMELWDMRRVFDGKITMKRELYNLIDRISIGVSKF